MKEKADEILSLLPKEQWDEVMGQEECDIEPVFMGFTEVYKALSQIIPKHFTIIDFGCAYNPQCFYFTEHKKYIAVDVSNCKKFKASNCDVHNCSIEAFIKSGLEWLNLKETFAICSYVPDSGARKLVRDNFKNVFTYYPHGGYQPIVIQVSKALLMLKEQNDS